LSIAGDQITTIFTGVAYLLSCSGSGAQLNQPLEVFIQGD